MGVHCDVSAAYCWSSSGDDVEWLCLIISSTARLMLSVEPQNICDGCYSKNLWLYECYSVKSGVNVMGENGTAIPTEGEPCTDLKRAIETILSECKNETDHLP